MTVFYDRLFRKLFDQDSGAVFEDMQFTHCTFDNCALSLTRSPGLRSTVRNVKIINCWTVNSDIGPAVFEGVTVDGLDTNALLILWSPLFKHVTLRGKVGQIKVNSAAHFSDKSVETQQPFDLARAKFYKGVDWALDISGAEFKEFDMHGVPARLVRRDPATQVVVTRERALQPGWRDRLSADNTHWPFVIDMFLADGEPDIVLVAPKGKRKRDFIRLLDGLNELRQMGVAEPD
jgi:hypothetical protein